MNARDIERIERDLAVTLPDEYARLMVTFPVPALRGNSDTDLWDDPDRLVARNRELRTESMRGHRPWPSTWFFIGNPLSASANAIDLSSADALTFWVDHSDLGSVENAAGQPFAEWLADWAAKSRADLARDGIDPDGEPVSGNNADPQRRWWFVIAPFALILAGMLLYLAVSLFRKLLH